MKLTTRHMKYLESLVRMDIRKRERNLENLNPKHEWHESITASVAAKWEFAHQTLVFLREHRSDPDTETPNQMQETVTHMLRHAIAENLKETEPRGGAYWEGRIEALQDVLRDVFGASDWDLSD